MKDHFRKLTFQTLTYGMGDMAVKLIAFFLIPLYTRSLTPEDYGVWSLIQTLQAILTVLLSVGLNTAVFKVYHDVEGENERKTVVSTALVFLGVWGILFTAALYALTRPLSEFLFHSRDQVTPMRFIFLSVFFDLSRIIALVTLRAREKALPFSILNVIHFTLLAILNIVNVAFRKRGVGGICESYLEASAVMAVITYFAVFRDTGRHFSGPRLKELLRFGIPLIPSGLAVWGLTMTAQYFIHFYSTDREVGLYSLGLRFGMIMNMILVRPFRTAWLPFMFSIQKERRADRVYAYTLTYYLAVATALFLLLSVLAREIVMITATPDYAEGYRVIPLIALAYLLYGMYYTVDVGVLITARTRLYAVITSLSAALQIGLNFIVVPRYGMMGAAAVVLASYGVLFAVMFFTSRKFYPIEYEWPRLLKIVLSGVLIYLAGTVFQPDGLLLSIICKLTVLGFYPVLLYILGFFHPEEKRSAAGWMRRHLPGRR